MPPVYKFYSLLLLDSKWQFNFIRRRFNMPLIQVQMFAGRTPQQKRDLVRALTDAFVETAGSTPESIDVILTDVEPSDWAQGGTLFSEKT